MSDENEAVEKTVEADPAVEQETTAVEVEETEDLGALKRALEREREERRQAKEELRRIREDEEAYRALGTEKFGFQFGDPASNDDDDEEIETEDDLAPVRADLDEIKQWKAQREAEERAQQCERDLSKFAEKHDVQLDESTSEWVTAYAQRGGPGTFNEQSLEDAVKTFKAFSESLRQSSIDGLRKSKKAPHVSQAGKAATQQPDLDDDAVRQKYMADRLAALDAQ